MEVVENETFTREYLDPAKRSIGNAVQVFFNDGTSTERIQVDYPIGHRRRRAEGIPVLLEKFDRNLRARLPARQADQVLALLNDKGSHAKTPASRLMDLLAV
jgi:2-methylcitrate dehydratase PrpD